MNAMRLLSTVCTILSVTLLCMSFGAALWDMHDDAIVLCLGVVPMSLLAMLSDAHDKDDEYDNA